MAALAVACSEDDPVQPETGITYSLVEAFPNLVFDSVVDLQDPKDGTNRLFVVEQPGIIRVFDNSPGVTTSRVYMDIETRVGILDYREKGLLSLAFDPQFAANGKLYVFYTATSKIDSTAQSRLSRFTVNPPTSNNVDESTEEVLLSFDQPHKSHNGGQIAFDNSGYLYVSIGDGGEPFRLAAQNTTTFFGTVIRIDVSTTPYSIPPGNPYTAPDLPEIFAHGFRNPWRMTIDPVTGMIFTGDVGSGQWEEIDVVEVGKNYGWSCRQGAHEHDFCADTTGFTDPIWEYSHAEGSAVVGGVVYRGSELPDLVGKYVYADYISGRMWALTFDGTISNVLLTQNLGIIASSFALDENGVLYICEYAIGASRIFKVVAR